jgi:adenine deaminase
MTSFSIRGHIIDVLNQRTIKGSIHIANHRILKLEPHDDVPDQVITPGLVDAHVHIESSMLIPSEFACLAVIHGTIATVSDPHEIANVLGVDGVRFMLADARRTPFKFHFTVPSCVPATDFETAGANLGPEDIRQLFSEPEMVGLSEMMNIPGVLNQDPSVLEKLAVAQELQRPVDGHGPGLQGDEATRYIQAGITADHECIGMGEALHKLGQGMKVQIREGSAARNLDDLMPLLKEHAGMCMLCSDDKHPDDLLEGHINRMVQRAIQNGYDPLKVLWAACVTPHQHYGLRTGLLQPGDPADLVVLDSLASFNVLQTWIDGKLVAENGDSKLASVTVVPVNRFVAKTLQPKDLLVTSSADTVPVIEVIDGQLVTERYDWALERAEQIIQTDPQADILKIAVLNRYEPARPAVGFIRGFGIRGAMASSVAHDSHNIVAVGSDDESLCEVMNAIIAEQGGIAIVGDGVSEVLPLPVAGIMSPDDGYEIALKYGNMDQLAKQLGSPLQAPFMTLSFMALLVIPKLKLSDRGLFDGERFGFLDVLQPVA